MSLPRFWQGDERWRHEVVGVDANMWEAGCVVSSLAILVDDLQNRDLTPLDVLKVLRKTLGAFVDGAGLAPGNLMVWPVALAPWGLQCSGAISSVADGEGLHELAGNIVDANADLAGELAAALVDGGAAVRVAVDASGKGKHTIACLGRDGDGFLCSDPALGGLVTLDANLENRDVKWAGKPHPYRAVAIRAVHR